jgi:hypothetical protein
LKPFDIVAAQPKAWTIISRCFQNDRVASTYLFAGPHGAGHISFALTVASLLNCEDRQIDTLSSTEIVRPCGRCENCRKIAELNFAGGLSLIVPIPPHKTKDEAIDLTNKALGVMREDPIAAPWTTSGVTLPIDMARDVKQALTRRADEGVTRVVIFDRMETMRTSSADALLKLIEEPPPSTVIIMTARRPDSVLPTLQSRAQLVRLRRVSEELVARHLSENYGVDERRALTLARWSEGLPGRAVGLATDSSDDDKSIRDKGWHLFKSLMKQPTEECIHLVVESVKPRNRAEAEQILTIWQSLIRDCSCIALEGGTDSITNLDFTAELEALSVPFMNAAFTERVTGEIKNTLADLVYNVHIHPAFIALILKIRRELDSLHAGSTPAFR